MDKIIKETYYSFDECFDKTAAMNIFAVGEVYCSSHYFFELQYSEHYVLEYIISGDGFLEKNGNLYKIKQEDIVFLPIKSKHKYYTSKENPQHKIYIIFCGSCFDSLVKSFIPNNKFIFQNHGLSKTFYNILYIAKTFNDNYDVLYENLYKEIFSVLYNATKTPPLTLSEEIKKNIDSQNYNKLDLKSISKNLGYSINYIINVFKKNYGISPYQYFLKKKVESAAFLLVNTNMTNEEISQKLNFSTLSCYYKCFKKVQGVSPNRYKKNSLNKYN